LLPDDQPAITTPYTPSDAMARMYSTPIGTSATIMST
jgi:hypothetical protein